MRSKFFLPDVPFHREAIQLGSLVPHITQPHQDALSTVEVVEGVDFKVEKVANFEELLQGAKKSSFGARLTALFQGASTAGESYESKLSSSEKKYYYLTHPDNLFTKVCSKQHVRTWIQSEIEAGSTRLYFIAGYYTLTDAHVKRRAQKGLQASISAEIPLADVIAGPASVVCGDSLNAGVAASHDSGYRHTTNFKTSSERVYGISYREVRFNWFDAKNVDKAVLKFDNCWVMVSDTKAVEDEDGEVVEVVLHDLEMDDSEFERFVVGDEQEYLYCKT